MGHIVEYIRGDYYRPETEQLRAITDPKERRKFKATHLDSVTVCGHSAEWKDDQVYQQNRLRDGEEGREQIRVKYRVLVRVNRGQYQKVTKQDSSIV